MYVTIKILIITNSPFIFFFRLYTSYDNNKISMIIILEHT